jgi:hypothetical protein
VGGQDRIHYIVIPGRGEALSPKSITPALMLSIETLSQGVWILRCAIAHHSLRQKAHPGMTVSCFV